MNSIRFTLLFNPDLANESTVQNWSGAAYHNGYLWLASDETNSLHRFTYHNFQFDSHRAFDLSKLITLPGKPKDEIDIEGLAIHDNSLWLTGSHSLRMPKWDDNRDPAENIARLSYSQTKYSENRTILARIPLQNDELLPGEVLAPEYTPTIAMREDEHLGPCIQAQVPAKANGLDIEGLAVLPDGKVVLGLRGPVFMDRALLLIAEPKPGALKFNRVPPAGQRYAKVFIKLDGLGVRDLLVIDNALYILAGPTMQLDLPASLYRVKDYTELKPDADIRPELLNVISCRYESENPEAIVVLDIAGKQTLLIIPDSPSPKRFTSLGTMELDGFALDWHS